jgi:hypothetical protein
MAAIWRRRRRRGSRKVEEKEETIRTRFWQTPYTRRAHSTRLCSHPEKKKPSHALLYLPPPLPLFSGQFRGRRDGEARDGTKKIYKVEYNQKSLGGGGLKSYMLICSDTFYSLAFTAKTLCRKFETNSVFPEMKLRSLVPNSYIYVLVSDLCIPTIGLPILLQKKRWTDRGNIQIAHR